MASGEPFSEQFQDFYFSTDGGLQETEYVFLKQNDLLHRFNELKENELIFRIGETGYGTGLNFLVTAYHWLQSKQSHCTLEYTAVEQYPLTQSQVEQVYKTFIKTWPQLSSCCQELLNLYPQDFPQVHNNTSINEMSLFNGRIHLKLIIDDATNGLKHLLSKRESTVNIMDAWYLDGFAPSKNPEMWTTDLFQTLAQLSQSGTTISTFTSAGIVRRGLIEAGFTMSKVTGLGKKREILKGIKE